MGQITGIILAGGNSTRMGKDKGLLDLHGKPLIQHVINIINPLVSSTIIIANNSEYNQFGYSVYVDKVKNSGPLAGIVTGLSHSTTNKNIVIGCDLPFISNQLLIYLIDRSEEHNITIPSHNNITQHLVGIYTKDCTSIFEVELENRRFKLADAIKLTSLNIVEIDESLPFYNEKLFHNINTPQELQEALK